MKSLVTSIKALRFLSISVLVFCTPVVLICEANEASKNDTLELTLPLSTTTLMEANEMKGDHTKIHTLRIIHDLKSSQQMKFFRQWKELQEKLDQFPNLKVLDLSRVALKDYNFLNYLEKFHPKIKILHAEFKPLDMGVLKKEVSSSAGEESLDDWDSSFEEDSIEDSQELNLPTPLDQFASPEIELED